MSTVTRILDAVAKHDPDAARVMAVDAWWEEASQARREMFDEQVPLLLHRWEAVGPRLAQRVGREYVVAKSADVDAAFDPRGVLAEYQFIGEVLKADDQFRRYGRIISVNRDTSGRFSRQSQGQRSDPSQWSMTREAGSDRRAAPENVRSYLQAAPQTGRGQWAQAQPADRENVATFLGAVTEVQRLQDDLRRSVGRKNVDDYQIVVQFERAPAVTLDAGTETYDWDVANGPVRQYSVVPKQGLGDREAKAYQRLQTFENMDALGLAGNVDERTLNRVAAVLNDSGDIDTPRTRRYASALRVGSQLAGAVGARGVARGLNTGAAALEEGERFRPALTRAAYRYRGTEKRPDPDLVAASQFKFGTSRGVAEHEFSDQLAMDLLSRRGAAADAKRELPEKYKDEFGQVKTRQVEQSLEDLADEAVLDPGKYGTVLPLVGQRMDHYRQSMYDAKPTTEQLRLAVQRDLVGQAFANRLLHSAARRSTAAPDNKYGQQGILGTGERNMDRLVADISQRIGRGLPSEGLLLDIDGNPVAQSVGLGGDHYQPFTAASLGKLAGGQYVRTRQYGGLTADDLRTMLTTNGRAGMVVSGSGVFDLEFDPTFRDQRRMSDKALGMIETYERILDQLAGQEVYARGLTPEQTAQVNEQARLQSGGDPDKYRELQEQLRKKKLFQGMELSPTEVATARKRGAEEWKAKYPSASDYDVAEAGEAEVQREQQNKVRALSLNAEGYEVALRTLQRYYPYFIRDVSYRSLKDLMSNSKFKSPDKSLAGAYGLAQSRATDREYVRPGMARFGDDARAYMGLPNQLASPGRPGVDRTGVYGRKPGESDDAGEAEKKPAADGAVPGGGAGVTPAAGGGAKPDGDKGEAPKQTAAQGLPPAVQLMADAAVSSMPRFQDQARSTLMDELGGASSLMTSWAEATNTARMAQNLREEPWDKPGSVATVMRIAQFPADQNVFGELVEFSRHASQKDMKQLRDAIKAQSYDGADSNSPESKQIVQALDDLVTRADAVGAVTTPWADPAMTVGFNGQPKAFDFVRSIASDADFAKVPDDPEVQQAVAASGFEEGLDTPYSEMRDQIAAAYTVANGIKNDPDKWGVLADTNPDVGRDARARVLQTILSGDPQAQQWVSQATDGLDPEKFGALLDSAVFQERLDAMEKTFAAKHLLRQAQAVETATKWLGGGGVDPKELLGLNLLQSGLPPNPSPEEPEVGKSQSPRLIVTRRLPRNHPVSVAVNKGFRLPVR